jgi:hypothetical protein
MSCTASAAETRSLEVVAAGTAACAHTHDAAVQELTRWPQVHTVDVPQLHGASERAHAVLAYALDVLDRRHAFDHPWRHPTMYPSTLKCQNSHACRMASALQQERVDTVGMQQDSRSGGTLHSRWASSRLVVVGGRDSGWRGLAAVAVYDVAEDSWIQGPPLPRQEPFARSVGLDGCVYVMGNTLQPQRLDTTAEWREWQWHCLSTQGYRPEPLCVETAVLGSDVWVLGGRLLPNQVGRCFFASASQIVCAPGPCSSYSCQLCAMYCPYRSRVCNSVRTLRYLYYRYILERSAMTPFMRAGAQDRS